MARFYEIYSTQWGRRLRKISQQAAASLKKLGPGLYTSIPALGYVAPPPTPAAPTVTTQPVLAGAGGATSVGTLLTVTPGVYTGSPTITRVWKKGTDTIAGQTGLTLDTTSLAQGDSITCVETATNAGGNVTGTSNAIVLT